jgi:DNA modification methylase
MDQRLTIIQGDALATLQTLADASIQCCVTSPPYWGLRDYGIAPIVWDATVECEHEWEDHYCHCGAWRGSLGLEPTPQLYVQHIVQIFRETRRVLRNNGTLWVNLGDTYAGGGNGGGGSFAKDGIRAAHPGTDKNVAARNGSRGVTVKSKRIPRGSGRWGGGNLYVANLKAKDLLGIPWMVAFALRADGWFLRCDIVWEKTNPMPESVRDRPTRSHEYIFLLSKSKKYYYDPESIKEPCSSNTHSRGKNTGPKTVGSNSRVYQDRDPSHPSVRKIKNNQSFQSAVKGAVTVRNRRSVWRVATAPYREAHFATFPPKLIEPCVLAGSSRGDMVLDPFAGSGTTGQVSLQMGRRVVLIEQNPEYVEMAKRRCLA